MGVVVLYTTQGVSVRLSRSHFRYVRCWMSDDRYLSWQVVVWVLLSYHLEVTALICFFNTTAIARVSLVWSETFVSFVVGELKICSVWCGIAFIRVNCFPANSSMQTIVFHNAVGNLLCALVRVGRSQCCIVNDTGLFYAGIHILLFAGWSRCYKFISRLISAAGD